MGAGRGRVATNVVLAARAVIMYSWIIGGSLCYQSPMTGNRLNPIRESFSAPFVRSSLLYGQVDANAVRELGGYERLLSRKTPGTDKLSLSHGTAFIFDGIVPHETVIKAVAVCMDRSLLRSCIIPTIMGNVHITRHPMLRAYISNDADSKKEYWSLSKSSTSILAEEVTSIIKVPHDAFDSAWRQELESAVNEASFPERGPLWRLKNIVSDSDTKKSAWVFCFNHGADDQQSVNIVVADILNCIYSSADNKQDENMNKKPLAFPNCVEDAIAPDFLNFRTAKWAIFQLLNQLQNTDMLPAKIIENYKKDPETYTEVYANPDNRRTFLEYLSLTVEETIALRIVCRSHGVTITNALSAAILYLTSASFQGGLGEHGSADVTVKEKSLRFLLSVGLRPFGVRSDSGAQVARSDWTGGTVACASGAVDFVVSVPVSKPSYKVTAASKEFWRLALTCKESAKSIIETEQYVPESVRLFGFGMKYAEILKIVDLESKNPGTMGRGYACGVSNVGLVDLPKPFPADGSNGLRIREGYYGTSHARNGVFCLLSTMTVGEAFCGCLQFTSPFISKEEATRFKEGLLEIVRNLA